MNRHDRDGAAPCTAELSDWQCTQAAMLLHFTAPEYLRPALVVVDDLIAARTASLIAMAREQGGHEQPLDEVMRRGAVPAWPHHACSALTALRTTLQNHLAQGAARHLRTSEAMPALDHLEDYLNEGHAEAWASRVQRCLIRLARDVVAEHVRSYESCIEQRVNRWNDAGFAFRYPAFAARHAGIHGFAVHPDIHVRTGDLAPRTGVYVSLDDPHAALQFAWTEHGGMRLHPANTFNEVGLAALASVGRQGLWFDDVGMYRFAIGSAYADRFRAWLRIGDTARPDLARYAVANCAMMARPQTWALVEPVAGPAPFARPAGAPAST